MSQEEDFVKRFIAESKQERYLQFLSKPKTRGKFLNDLYHRLMLKESFVNELLPGERTIENVGQRLQMLGSGIQVYVISPYERLDQQWFALPDILTDILSTGTEAIVCCLPGQLAFVQTEDSAYILHYQPRKPIL